ncbi:MAG: hypothetical protein M3296_07640 [Actinomycetota bacterium]|nr:hypothetical protein [Actinomycetota bacterium]
MKRMLMVAATTAVAAAPAGAVSPSQQQCEAQGGTFTRDRGQAQCIIVEEGKNTRFTQETTTTGQGNINNKQQTSSECTGTGSGKCPAGQFR